MTGSEPDVLSWARLLLAFTVVFSLLVGLGFTLKFIKTRGLVLPGMKPVNSRRLQILETLPLDVRRRLVIVRCDDVQHLLLLGQDRDIVIETRLNENHSSLLRAKSEP